MSEWKEYRLGDISKTIQTGPFGSQLHQSDYVDDGIPCIMPKNIGQHLNINCEEIAKVKPEDLNRLNRYKVIYGDIVYSRRGDIEKCAYITKEQTGWLCGTGCLNVRINEDLADSKFIAYYLSLPNTKSWLKKSAVGTTMLNLNTSILADVPITMPSLDEQRAIASILSSLDSKIENNRKICANLEAQAQALFKHWFIDFAPFKDGKFVESELGMIPEGWRVGKLSCLGDIIGGATPSKSVESNYCQDGIHWLTPKDLSKNCLKFTSRGETDITLEGYASCSAKIMPRGSVLFSSRAPIGYLTIAKNEICTNQGFKSIVPRYAGTAYIYYLLKYNTKRIEKLASGTTFKEVSGSLMKSLPIIIPTKSYLIRFENSVKELFDEQELLESQISHLSTLRDTLLPKLMSGEIKV